MSVNSMTINVPTFVIKKSMICRFNLIPDLNLYENIEVPLRYRIKAAERKRRIEQCLEQVGLASRAKHLPQRF